MPSFLQSKDINVLTNNIASGVVGWRSPSNIALIKYWGKYGNQMPRNASLSITLSNSYTETFVEYEVQKYASEEPSLEFYFEGKPHEAFRQKIQDNIRRNIAIIPYVKHLHLTIESQNSFPHSSGIASSASSMSALALCLCTIEQQLFSGVKEESTFYQRASLLARLFSGSASRSVYAKMSLWGECEQLNNSSDLYAVSYTGFHINMDSLHDDILIVNPKEKPVSSREGHQLMEKNPFAQARYKQARSNLAKLMEYLQKGDVWALGRIIEDEALTLHALMMSSDPSYILMEPNTLKVIKEIRKFRGVYKIPVFFTLDAGPNVHILYPEKYKEECQRFIKKRLLKFSPEGRIIADQMGPGPVLKESSYKTT